MVFRVALTLRPGGLSDELLQPLHLGVHLLVVGLPGVHLRCGEEGRVRAHVGAQEVAVGAQADHHSFQLPVERKEEKGKERKGKEVKKRLDKTRQEETFFLKFALNNLTHL